jgi:hypothetical protein
MKWAALLLLLYGLVAGFAETLFGPEHRTPAYWSLALLISLIIAGQVVNLVASRFGPEAAILGDASRVLLRMVGLMVLGLYLEISGLFPSRTLLLWGWLLAGTLTSLAAEIAILLKITK